MTSGCILHTGLVSPSDVAEVLILLQMFDMMCFSIIGGPSIVKVKMVDRAPRLHYVYPLCFEVGMPIEFVACGSNLRESKFRYVF